MKENIRNFKNNLIQAYFRNRIYGDDNYNRILLRKKPYKFIFILSHMRSGSSLLTHILVSNPAVIGFGESHIKYNCEADFNKLMMKAYYQYQEFSQFPEHLNKLKMNQTYVLDKILHNQKIVNNRLINLDSISVIFLIREPERTLASLLDLKSHWNQKNAFDYYIDRLSKLVKYAEQINNPQRTLFITHEQLLNQTKFTLNKLQQFLQTKQPFSEEYELTRSTGQKYIGDHKGNIKAGKIIRQNRKLNHQIEENLLTESRHHYQQCCQTLAKLCTNITNN
jgi:hypothetical protein